MFNPTSILPIPNQNVTWGNVVKNNGSDNASSVIMNLTISDGLSVIGYEVSKGSYDSETNTWYIGGLLKDESVNINIYFSVVGVPIAGQSVESNVFANVVDTNITNNTITDTLPLNSLPAPPCAADQEDSCLCGSVKNILEKCIGCDTRYEVLSGSLVNLVLNKFDIVTGDYNISYIDTALPASFKFNIKCINCSIGGDSISSCDTTVSFNPIQSGTTLGNIIETPLIAVARIDVIRNAINNDLMDNYYQQNSLLPTSSPFTGQVLDTSTTWNVTNTATSGAKSVTDWIFLWIEQDDVIIQTRSGLLLADGSIVGLDGVSPIKFNIASGYYKIGLKVRASLRIRTKNKYLLGGDTLFLDFSNGSVLLDGVNNVEPKNGFMCLILGDLNGDNLINSLDEDIWVSESGLFDDYSLVSDVSLSGSSDSSDLGIIENNLGKQSY